MTKITIDKPGYPPAHKAFRIEGSFDPPYATPPTLTYADDVKVPGMVSHIMADTAKQGVISLRWSVPPANATYHPLPQNSGVNKKKFHFRHPGFAPGHHAVAVTDGKIGASVGFGVAPKG